MKNAEIIKSYVSLVNARYTSKGTRSAYITCLHQWMEHIGQPQRATKCDIRDYIADLEDSKYNHMLASLHLMYKEVLSHPQKLSGLRYRQTSPKIWQVLSQEEVRDMIAHTSNHKHKMIITLLYTLGLRLSELLHLQLRDINRATMQIQVHRGKGAKDRLIDIDRQLLYKIEAYWRRYRPTTYIIESTKEGRRYSASSVAAILSRHSKRLKKHVTPHLLRHSIASHLINQKINLLELQKFLGHANPQTTQYYYHYVKSGTITLAQSQLLNAA